MMLVKPQLSPCHMHITAFSCQRPYRKPVAEQCSGIMSQGLDRTFLPLPPTLHLKWGKCLTEQVVCDHVITGCAVIHAHNVRAELRPSRQL